MQIVDDPTIVELAKKVISRAATAHLTAIPWFYVSRLPEVGSGYFVRSRAHGVKDFVITCAFENLCEQAACYMNGHPETFDPKERPIVLGEKFYQALKSGAFKFKFSAQ